MFAYKVCSLIVFVGVSIQQTINRSNTTDCADTQQYTCGGCTRVYISPKSQGSTAYTVMCTACKVGQPNERNEAFYVDTRSTSRIEVGKHCDSTHMTTVWLSVCIAGGILLVGGVAFWIYNMMKQKQLQNRHYADESVLNGSGFTHGMSAMIHNMHPGHISKSPINPNAGVPMQYGELPRFTPNHPMHYGPSFYEQG